MPIDGHFGQVFEIWTFRFDVNMDFAHTNHGRFFDLGLQKIFGGLNQKSAMISMCKIHIYIDSESFRQIQKKGVTLGQNWVLRYGHFGEFLEFFLG